MLNDGVVVVNTRSGGPVDIGIVNMIAALNFPVNINRAHRVNVVRMRGNGKNRRRFYYRYRSLRKVVMAVDLGVGDIIYFFRTCLFGDRSLKRSR